MLSIFQLKPVLQRETDKKADKEQISFYELYKYSINVILFILCFNVFTNITMIMVKHFFEPNIAGYYAGAEIISKIVLFISGVIPVMLFPKTASLHAQNIDSRKVLLKGLAVTSLFAILFILVCFFFSKDIINLFFGQKYIEGSFLLGPLAVIMTFYTLSNIMAISSGVSANELCFNESL